MKKRANADLQRQQQKKTRHQARCQAKQGVTAPNSRGEAMVGELFKTIHHVFPDCFAQLRQIEDCRRRSD